MNNYNNKKETAETINLIKLEDNLNNRIEQAVIFQFPDETNIKNSFNKLTYLNLNNCGLNNLECDAVKHLHSIRKLILSFNQLKYLKDSNLLVKAK